MLNKLKHFIKTVLILCFGGCLFFLMTKSIDNVGKQFIDPDVVNVQQEELAEFIKDSEILNVEISFDNVKSIYTVTRFKDGKTESKDFDGGCFQHTSIAAHRDYESPDDKYHIVFDEENKWFVVYYPSTYFEKNENTSWKSD